MKLIVTLLLMAGLTVQSLGQSSMKTSYNHNMEFLGFMYSIVYENENNERYDSSDPNWEYGRWMIPEYAHYSDDPLLDDLLPEIEHMSISKFFYLLTHVADFPNAQLTAGLDTTKMLYFSDSEDAEEAFAVAGRFLDRMNTFYQTVHFDQYLEQQSVHYKAANKKAQSNTAKYTLEQPLITAFGKQFKHHQFYISLTLPPGGGYSVSDRENAYQLLCAQSQQRLSENDYGYGDHKLMAGILTHEAGHNYIAPYFNQIPEALFAKTAYLHEPIAEAMKDQDYLNWETVVNEHITRASEVLAAKVEGDAQRAANIEAYHIQERSFIYLPVILKHMDSAYENKSSMAAAFINALKELSAPEGKAAQKQGTVRGVIKDRKTGEVLPFVHIGIPGKNMGVISRPDGTFTIDLQQAETTDSLVISSIGFARKAVAVKGIQEQLTIVLERNVIELPKITVRARESKNFRKLGRFEPTKTTRGQNGITDFGFGQEYGVRVNRTSSGYMLQDVNLHMRFNSADSILFRINIYDIQDDLPNRSLLPENLFMTSRKGKKWTTGDFSDMQLVIDQDVIVTFEVIRVYYREKGRNNIFFTYGEGYTEGGTFVRNSSFDSWKTSEPDAFPITLYVTGRVF